MLPIILIVVAAVVVIVLIVVAIQPAEFRVARTALVSAPPAALFEQVNDFHKWEAWNPWGKIDPAMKQTYEGPPAGVGSTYTWSGDNKVGEGRMTITESRPNELVRINLEFIKPFRATNTTEFTLEPRGDQTAVTWSMTGRRNFMMKSMGLFMNMDRMIGSQYEKGLADIKAIVEHRPAA